MRSPVAGRSRIAGLAALVIGLPMLSGCTFISAMSLPIPPIYARVEEGLPVFLVCVEEQPLSVEVAVADRGTTDYREVWSTSGAQDVPFGTPLTFGTPWPGWATDADPTEFEIRDVAISVTVARTEGRADDVTTVFGGWNLIESGWVDGNGAEVEGCS